MRKGKNLILSFLLIIQINFCKNVTVGKKNERIALFLHKIVDIKKIKFNFRLKDSCTFLTGIKPSGSIHLGNYIGCLHPLINVEAKKKNTNYVSKNKENVVKLKKIILIADLHCLTDINNMFFLKQNVLDSVKVIISLIIDMYIKKKEYINIYINNIKLEKILTYFKSGLIDEAYLNKLLCSINVYESYSFLNYEKQKDDFDVVNNAHNIIQGKLFNDEKTKLSKKSLEEKNISGKYERTAKKNIFQKHYFYIFKQSDIQAHTSLYYLINSFTSINLLNDHIHIKSSGKNKSFALISYPNLMLADILLYEPKYLIVGLDQKKNVEIIKKISKKVNTYFPHTVILPNIFCPKFHIEVMNLDGQNKMSKNKDLSDNENINKIIYLFDEKDVIEKKIKKSKTDNYNILTYAKPNTKEINNLINIFLFFYYYKVKNVCAQTEKEKTNKRFQLFEDNLFLNEREHSLEKNHKTNFKPGTPENVESSNDNIKCLSYLKKKKDIYTIKNSSSKINEEKLFFKHNNVNPNINQETINNILSFYNNNYSNFKYELSQLIYDHFVVSKHFYNIFYSHDNLVDYILKRGKKCLSKRASKTFKKFKRRLNI
ncbi:tryptophan--tRNA ligase, putative [Plasmodium malariae]|uniref:Tryptophan--tRNA ligase, putative n=1 Tax=Plasmodium malariae TaxID=5858 RepID=A0A1D3TFQ4_PLAMA|nr:tryptophan--tRNA ligase, putative [Plasmodium malariae]SCP03788.1 tryptophan--tRNA ligase, putative [Plasmodium malariae]